jgi:hypothetical protein
MDIYDVQGRALLHGHLSLPPGSIGFEGFVHDGRTYTYFGLFPSIIRMPILAVTHSLDGHLTALSILLSWVVTAVFSCLLVWRVRSVLRPDASLGWAEAVSYGVLIFSFLAGSVLVFLAAFADVYSEDEAWSVALACGSLYALLTFVERPTWNRAILCGVLVTFTNLNRGTTGYACILATLLLAGWCALGRGGPERRRWALPLLLVALVALAIGCAIDLARFGVLFGYPESEQNLYKAFDFAAVNHGHHYGLTFVPSTLLEYLSPTNLHIARTLPFISLPTFPTHLPGNAKLFNHGNTASATASMPLLVLAALWGVVAAFRHQESLAARSLRILIVPTAATAGAILIYGTIYERFLADFMPLLVLASIVGLVDLWQRLGSATRRPRTVALAAVTLLALFGFVANMGIASTPQDDWTSTQAEHFVRADEDLSQLTGQSLDVVRVKPGSFPLTPQAGQLLVRSDCRALYLSDGEGPDLFYPLHVWLPVKLPSHSSLCASFPDPSRGRAK